MAILEDLQAKWTARAAEAQRFGTMVNLEALCDDVLGDLSALITHTGEPTIPPVEAARVVGCHPETIKRHIRSGALKNYGTKRRPRVRLSQCPRRLSDAVPSPNDGCCAPVVAEATEMDASSSTAVLALDVLASRRGSRRRAPDSPRSA